MKILFTSVGRRVELIQAFRNAAKKLNTELEIYGADMDASAPALSFCDHTVIVPRINSDDYIPKLVEICRRESINALIPTIDTDLLILAKHKRDFRGTIVIVSDEDKVRICRDKRITSSYFTELGLNSPTSTDDYKIYCGGFPAFIKPKDGSSSIFAYKVNSEKELVTYAKQVPDYIIQPFIKGTEYTVDILCDFKGNPILITPRIRLAVRAGEVLKTQISQDDTIIEEAKTIVQDFKPCGQITVQLIREQSTGKDFFIEINPRFGGGAPLTMKAGADSAEVIITLLKGDTVTYKEKVAENGAVYCRYDQSVRVK